MPAVYVEVARRCMRGGCTICLNVDGEGGEVVPRFFVYIKADAAFGAMFRCGRCAYAYRSASICNVPNGADNRDILQERGGARGGTLSPSWVLGFGFWVLGSGLWIRVYVHTFITERCRIPKGLLRQKRLQSSV